MSFDITEKTIHLDGCYQFNVILRYKDNDSRSMLTSVTSDEIVMI